MPELPEVETTVRGLSKYLLNGIVEKTQVHRADLRYAVPHDLAKILKLSVLRKIIRRSKYIVMEFHNKNNKISLIIHLGMSGSLRLEQLSINLKKHDHIQWTINTQNKRYYLRYHDPRRFGCVITYQGSIFDALKNHKLLKKLGPEPLMSGFNPRYFVMQIHNRRSKIKQIIMNAQVVVGVGNIYASESLFLAGVNPHLLGNSITEYQATLLVKAIKQVLIKSIEKGGTTLRDFVNGEGKPGYFQQELWVYDREGLLCKKCLKGKIVREQIAQRSSFYCPHCQLKI